MILSPITVIGNTYLHPCLLFNMQTLLLFKLPHDTFEGNLTWNLSKTVNHCPPFFFIFIKCPHPLPSFFPATPQGPLSGNRKKNTAYEIVGKGFNSLYRSSTSPGASLFLQVLALQIRRVLLALLPTFPALCSPITFIQIGGMHCFSSSGQFPKNAIVLLMFKTAC